MTTQTFYRHSGRVPFPGLLMTLGGGLAAAVALAFVYAYAIHYIPFVYVNALLALFFGGALGTLTGTLARAGKLRSGTAVGLAGLAAGVLGLYVHWGVWLALAGAPSAGDLLAHPGMLWSVTQLVNAAGPWAIFDWTPTGFALWAFWGIEAFLIVGLSAGVAAAYISSLAFCEGCSVWTQEEKTVGPLEPVPDRKAMRVQAERGDLTGLRGLARCEEPGHRYAELKLFACPSCQQLRLVTVRDVAREVGKKGEEKKNEELVFANLILDHETYAALAQL